MHNQSGKVFIYYYYVIDYEKLAEDGYDAVFLTEKGFNELGKKWDLYHDKLIKEYAEILGEDVVKNFYPFLFHEWDVESTCWFRWCFEKVIPLTEIPHTCKIKPEESVETNEEKREKIKWEVYSTEDLINMYIRYREKRPEWAREIEEELKKRGVRFCPVHHLPLEEVVIAGVVLFKCPRGEYWKLKDTKLVPVSPAELARLRKMLVPPAPPTPPERVTVEKPVRFEPLHYKYAKAMAPPEMKELVDVFAMLSIDLEFGITRPEDFLNIPEIVKRARASAYYLYQTEPEEYERLKEKYKNVLPPDLFKQIFAW